MDPYFQNDDIKLIDLLRGFKTYSLFVLKRFYIVVAATILLYYGGRWFADISDKLWVANASFNAIDARSGGFGSMMSLASSLGFGVGGGSSNDVLSGIFSSRNVIKSAFLEEIDYNGTKEKIGNIYLEVHGLMDVFRATPGMEEFKFTAPDVFRLSPIEDSVMTDLYTGFIDDYLVVEFDPLAGLIRAGVYTPDKTLSTRLCEVMLRKTNEFYSITSSQKAMESYTKLNRRVDSLAGVINARNLEKARMRDQNIFNKKELGVVDVAEIDRDITVLSLQYNDAVASLEAAKAGLSSESQVMRIVDVPAYSTEIDERDADFWGIIGLAVGFALSIIILCFVKAARDGFEEELLEQQRLNTTTIVK
jgi:hypothetical protein